LRVLHGERILLDSSPRTGRSSEDVVAMLS